MKKQTNLETLRRRTLQEVIKPANHNRTLPGTMHLEPTNRPPMTALDLGQRRHLLQDRHEFLARVFLLVCRAHVVCGNAFREGHRQCADDAGEPRRDAGREGDFDCAGGEEGREVVACLAFVDVVRQCVWPDPTCEALCCDLGHGGGPPVRCWGASDGACAAVA